VVLAPAEAFGGGEEFGFGGLEDGATGEADEIAPAVLAFIKAGTDSPNAGVVMRVWTGSDEETVHCPVVIRAERQADVGRVIAAYVEGDEVGRVDEGKPSPSLTRTLAVLLKGRCPYCATELDAHQDQMVHVSAAFSGSNSLPNRVPAYKPCNAVEKRD
jgi:hypothetical protein